MSTEEEGKGRKRERVEINESDSAKGGEKIITSIVRWPARGACCCVTPCCISRKEKSQCASTGAGNGESEGGLISQPRTPVVNHPVSDIRVIAGSLPLLCPPYFDPAVIDMHRVVTNRVFL